MMPHPTCTKETRTTNDSLLRKQQEIKYSQQYMQKYQQEHYQKQNNNLDIQSWANNMNNIGNSFYEYNLNQNQNNQQMKMNTNYNQKNQNSNYFYNQGEKIINTRPNSQQNTGRQPIGGMNEYSRFDEDAYLRSKSSSTHIPIDYNHEGYMKDQYSTQIMGQIPANTRNIGKMKVDEKPIQQCFQQDYFMSNFETLNHMNKGVPMFDNNEFTNHFMDRNPTNTRRDQEEKARLNDNRSFKNYQGGPMNSFVDLNPQYTRKEKNNINSSSYVPMARTLALPRDKV